MSDVLSVYLGAFVVLKTRYCNRCESDLPDTDEFFYRGKRKAFTAPCKECRKAMAREKHRESRDHNNARMRQYRLDNLDVLNEKAAAKRSTPQFKAWQKETNQRRYAENREAMRNAESIRRFLNADVIRERERVRNASEHRKQWERDWRAANVEIVRERERVSRVPRRQIIAQQAREARARDPERFRGYDKKRQSDPSRKMCRSLNTKIRKLLVEAGTRKQAEKAVIVGWTIAELRDHLSALFSEGMSFDNYGEWEIDHIIPVSKVVFDDENDIYFKRLWSLENLAPLWAFDNNSKHNRLDWKLPDTYVNPLLRAMYDTPACADLVFVEC